MQLADIRDRRKKGRESASMHTREYIIWSIGTGVRMHTIVV